MPPPSGCRVPVGHGVWRLGLGSPEEWWAWEGRVVARRSWVSDAWLIDGEEVGIWLLIVETLRFWCQFLLKKEKKSYEVAQKRFLGLQIMTGPHRGVACSSFFRSSCQTAEFYSFVLISFLKRLWQLLVKPLPWTLALWSLSGAVACLPFPGRWWCVWGWPCWQDHGTRSSWRWDFPEMIKT